MEKTIYNCNFFNTHYFAPIIDNMKVIVSRDPIKYEKAIKRMQHITAQIAEGLRGNTTWLLEHFPVYTAGYTTYKTWLEKYGEQINGIPIVEAARGGKITYHGPGQRVCYLMLNVKRLYGEVNLRWFLNDIYQVIIMTLQGFGIKSLQDKVYPGVWVKEKNHLHKIAAVGIKIQNGISSHGFALNVNNDMSFFDCIDPCGIKEQVRGVTSITKILGSHVKLTDVDVLMQQEMEKVFGNDWKSTKNY